ncbi:cytochrome P450 [Mycena rebaudengoi]|nr:cytochrome P450 [Mycena rebaudengoi]
MGTVHPLPQSIRPKKLREELLLNSLPYLDNVVRETLRAHTPPVSVRRMALVDDIIPLSTPYTGRKGVVHANIPVRKGQQLHLSLLGVNTDKALWGENAAELKPEGWDNLPKGIKAIPGVWSNLMTFFAGPHNCIEFQFSVAE